MAIRRLEWQPVGRVEWFFAKRLGFRMASTSLGLYRVWFDQLYRLDLKSGRVEKLRRQDVKG